jgi:hypothetical protein
MAAFQFYLQPMKHIKIGWVGDDSHVVFVQKFPGEKRSMSQFFFAKVCGEVLAHFHTVSVECQ